MSSDLQEIERAIREPQKEPQKGSVLTFDTR